jgi:hypothetical protein
MFALEAPTPLEHGALVDAENHRDVRGRYAVGHEQQRLPANDDPPLGLLRPHRHFDLRPLPSR